MNFRYQKKTFLLFSACLLIATLFSPIHQPTAAPDKTSSFLLSEPVSMMTFGLYRVNEELVNKFYKEKSFAEDMNVYANYFPESDLYLFFYTVVGMKQNGRLLMHALRPLTKFENLGA